MNIKRCVVCAVEFEVRKIGQKACSPRCAIIEVKAKKKRKAEKKKAPTKQDLKKRTQDAFNSFIRTRDMHQPCISCGQSPYKGRRNASHYRSVAAAGQLRFNCWNVHASCAQCNTSKSGNLLEYRIALVQKIGVERVESLENNNSVRKYSDEYLRRIEDIFKRRAKHYQKIRGR